MSDIFNDTAPAGEAEEKSGDFTDTELFSDTEDFFDNAEDFPGVDFFADTEETGDTEDITDDEIFTDSDTAETGEIDENIEKNAPAKSRVNRRAQPPNNITEVFLPALILTAICTTATLILALTNLLTAGKIAANAAEKAAAVRREVMQAADYTQLDDEGKVYSALDYDGSQLGVIVTTEAKGYGGTIQVMTGIRPSGSVSKVVILSMSETPGLGAKTKETSFLDRYIGSDEPNLAVDKDGGSIAAVSGATISSRAVTEAVNEAISVSAAYLDAQ